MAVVPEPVKVWEYEKVTYPVWMLGSRVVISCELDGCVSVDGAVTLAGYMAWAGAMAMTGVGSGGGGL